MNFEAPCLNIDVLWSVGSGQGIAPGPRRASSRLGSVVGLPSDQVQDCFLTYKQLGRVNMEYCIMIRYWYHHF